MCRSWLLSALHLALAIATPLLTPPLYAQEQPATFEFSFSNPGARSMALGGAFAALADDATAAFANPAGLVQLIEPEISAEGRYSFQQTEFVNGGRVAGEPSGFGLDTVRGLSQGVSEQEQTGAPFASVVLPAKRWSFALYRHQWADFQLESRIHGLFGVEDGEDTRAGDLKTRIAVEVVNTGLSAAFKVSSTFSLGVGVVYYKGLMDSFAEEFAQDEEDFYGPSAFSPDRLDTSYSHQADDSGFTLHGGFLWRPSPQWSVGGYYREGPKLDLRVIEIAGPAEGDDPAGTIELDETSPLSLPDVYGLGLAFRSKNGAWTVSGEWSRVGYSSITQGLSVDVLDPDQVLLDDGDEFHLGLEYVVVRSKPIVALRLGAWLDPAHRVRPGPDADLFERAVFDGGEDQTHVTGGLGLVFRKMQLDLGVDVSEFSELASLSLVYRF